MAEPSAEQLRKEIALQLKQHERDLAMGGGRVAEPPQPLDPRSMRPKEPGDPGPPAKASGAFDYMLQNPKAPDGSYAEQVGAGLSDPGGMAGRGGPPTLEEAPDMAKAAGRGALRVASGGGTEAVAKATGSAEEKAVPAKQMSEEERMALFLDAHPELRGAAAQGFVRVPPAWQPGTRTNAEGMTSKDPNAVRAAMELQGVSEEAQAKGLQQTQKADIAQYQDLLAVQKNSMEATKAFKAEHDAMQARYDGERQAQMERLGAIQKAMDAVPNAPRTIRQKMDRSGFSDKAALGLAAAFSVLGGATLRDGGRSVQTFLGNVQANIDRDVQKEADEFARLGERAKMSDNIYAHLRQGLQDDVAAMNLTKALYYDAAANAVQQIATQYKMDTQSVQVQSLLQHLAEQRQKLILDTANNMQTQFSQTDKFNPGGVFAVGGGAASKPKGPPMDSKELSDAMGNFDKVFKEEGGPGAHASGQLMRSALAKVAALKKNPSDKFWKALAMFGNPSNAAVNTAIQAVSDPDEAAALQDIGKARANTVKDEAGKSVTVGEALATNLQMGGYSVDGLRRFNNYLDQQFKGAVQRANNAYGGPPDQNGLGVVTNTWWARNKLFTDSKEFNAEGMEVPPARFDWERRMGAATASGSDSKRSE